MSKRPGHRGCNEFERVVDHRLHSGWRRSPVCLRPVEGHGICHRHPIVAGVHCIRMRRHGNDDSHGVYPACRCHQWQTDCPTGSTCRTTIWWECRRSLYEDRWAAPRRVDVRIATNITDYFVVGIQCYSTMALRTLQWSVPELFEDWAFFVYVRCRGGMSSLRHATQQHVMSTSSTESPPMSIEEL